MDAIIISPLLLRFRNSLEIFFLMHNSLIKNGGKRNKQLENWKEFFSLVRQEEFLAFLLMDEELGGKENYPIPVNSKVDLCISNSPFPSKFLPPPILSCNQQYYLSTHEVRFEKFTWNTPSECWSFMVLF